MTREEFNAGMQMLLRAWPKAEVVRGANGDVGTLDVYFAALQDLDAQTWKAAVIRCLNYCTFFPQIAEIRKQSALLIVERKSGAEAWGEVLRAMNQRTGYGQPEFSDGRIVRSIRAVSWDAIRFADVDDPSVRAQFIRCYDRLVEGEIESTMEIPALADARAQIKLGARGDVKQIMAGLSDKMSVKQ